MTQRLAQAPATLQHARIPGPRMAAEANVVHNMSPGPGALPKAVLYRAQQELISWPSAPGQSVMCVSHRENNGPYQKMAAKVMQQVRSALDVPAGYQVLFMHGGAHGQFAAVPLNLAGANAMVPDAPRARSTSIDTGFWARRAAAEHSKYVSVAWGGSSSDAEPIGQMACPQQRDFREARVGTHTSLPDPAVWKYGADDAFIHICANETIHGIEFVDDPVLPAGAPPLVADFTSNLLTRPVDVGQYGAIYCSGGKNIGPAGLTLVLVRDELLSEDREHPLCPSMLSYRTLAQSLPQPNLYLTPPTFGVYMLGLMLDWVQASGGLEAAEQRAIIRASKARATIAPPLPFQLSPIRSNPIPSSEPIRSNRSRTIRYHPVPSRTIPPSPIPSYPIPSYPIPSYPIPAVRSHR